MDTNKLQCALWSVAQWPKMLLMPFENRDNLAKDAQEECVAMNDHEFLEPPIIETMPITSLENDLKI